MPQKAPPMAPAPTRWVSCLTWRLTVGVAHDLGGVLQLDDHVFLHLSQLEAEGVGLGLVFEPQDHQLAHTRSF